MEEHQETLTDENMFYHGSDRLSLSARFVFPNMMSSGSIYATVSSTIIMMDMSFNVTMIERSWARLFQDHPELLKEKEAFISFCSFEQNLRPYETKIEFSLRGEDL